MQALFNVQEDIQSKLSKANINFKKSPKDRLTVTYIETRLENLEQQWQLFCKTHTKIVSGMEDMETDGCKYFDEEVYETVEDVYIQYKSDMKELLSKLKVSVVEQKLVTNKETTRIKLPEVKIPIFSGKYSEWQTFRDLFVGLIHRNPNLDDAQKLYYLKGNLSGEAQQLLCNIDITADNYQSSWETLESMYNNKKFMANEILKKLLNQKALTAESAVDIKRIICTTTDCSQAIKNLGINIATWDIIIIHLISAKLDKDTKKAWELHIAAVPGDELPKFAK